MDERAGKLVSAWLSGLSLEGRKTLYSLLDELCRGIDVSRHNPFGFLRLRAEFETSGELFGCTVPELRDAVAVSLGRRHPGAGNAAKRSRILAGRDRHARPPRTFARSHGRVPL